MGKKNIKYRAGRNRGHRLLRAALQATLMWSLRMFWFCLASPSAAWSHAGLHCTAPGSPSQWTMQKGGPGCVHRHGPEAKPNLPWRNLHLHQYQSPESILEIGEWPHKTWIQGLTATQHQYSSPAEIKGKKEEPCPFNVLSPFSSNPGQNSP